ncbi:hypothetical protein [Kineococcus sp. SYSU DK003]|uniref:hypothetical protein n=1 Tax=Kineococcus sp. SYSU DK003 TaxID=3383124 RepID=UPI003D7E964B
MPRINADRAGTLTLTSFATLTLLPLLALLPLRAPAMPGERVLLLLAAVPAAALFNYLAGHLTGDAAESAGCAAHRHDEQLQDIQRHLAQLQAAQRSATTIQPSAPVTPPVSEPVPGPGTGSPISGGHLATLARPPAGRHPGS